MVPSTKTVIITSNIYGSHHALVSSHKWPHNIRVNWSLVLCVCFVDRCVSFCAFSFGHYVVWTSSIYGFWLSLWYLQTLLPFVVFTITFYILSLHDLSRFLFIMSSTIGASNGAGHANHSGVTEFIFRFHVAQSFVLCFVDNYWSFLLYFFFPLYCLSIVLQLLINRLICSNLS